MNVQKKIAIGFIRAKLNGLVLINRKKAGEEAFKLFCTPFTRSKKQSDLFKEAEKLLLSFGQYHVKGFRFNPSGKKKLLILHGFSSGSQHFEQYIQPLIAKNYEILAFDAPAHGASEGKSLHALDYSDMIRAVSKEYGPIHAYLAHSMGGLAVCLALETMEHGPDTKLVLIAPATETTTAIKNAFILLGLKNPDLKSALEAAIRAKSGKEAEWYSIRRAMHHIRATVSWFHDEEDETTPLKDVTYVMEDGHQHIRFRISKGLGHSKIYRDAGVVKQVVEFL